MECLNCGGDQFTVVSQLGSLETWRCNTCTHECMVHVHRLISDEVVRSWNLETRFEIALEWHVKPSAEALRRLAELFPDVKEWSLAKMLRASYEKKIVALGRASESELETKSDALMALGVKIIRI